MPEGTLKEARTFEQSKKVTGDHHEPGSESVSEQPFRILDLPPELWLRVCHFAVVQPEPITVADTIDKKAVEAILAQPAITKTCRTVRAEALAIFYSANEFRFHDYDDDLEALLRWMRAISKSWPQVKHCTIKTLYPHIVEFMTSSGFTNFSLEGKLPGGADLDVQVLKFTASPAAENS